MIKKVKLISILVITTLFLSITPSIVCADTVQSGICGANGDNLTWKLDADGTLTISGAGEMANWLGDAFNPSPWNYNKNIKKVIINDGVTSIGSAAFMSCYTLTDVSIPDSVTTISENAFLSAGLKSLRIPSGVKYINRAALACKDLTEISVDSDNPNYCSVDGNLFNKDKSELILYAASKPDKTFSIPDGITTIGDLAFSHSSNLTDVKISNSVKTIGVSAFFHCENLTDINIPNGVTSIGRSAFGECYKLANINLPDSVISIGEDAFIDTAYYEEPENWNNGVLYIGNYLICAADFSDESFDVKDGTVCIADLAFENCQGLKNANIPSSVRYIGENAFLNCLKLLNISIDKNNSSYSSIDGVLFNKNQTELIYYPLGKKDSSYTLPDDVTNIKLGAFAYNENLNSVTFPKSVTTVESEVFYDCINLTGINYSGTKNEWNKIKFDETNDKYTAKLIIYCSDGEIYPDIVIDGVSVNSSTLNDNLIYTFDVRLLYVYTNCKLMAAVYDENDALIGFNEINVNLAENSSNIEVTIKNGTPVKAKLFVWNNISNITPLGNGFLKNL